MGTSLNKTSMFNSFLLAIVLAVMSWIGVKVANVGERVASIEASLAVRITNADQVHSAIDVRLKDVETRLRGIDVEIMKLHEELRRKP